MKRKHTSIQEDVNNPFDRGGKKIHWLQSRMIILSSLFTAIVLTHHPILNAYARWLSPEDTDPSADIAIVLDTYVDRLEEAIKLLKEKKVKALYINAMPRSSFNRVIEKYNLTSERVYWGGCRIFTTYDQPIAFLEGVERHNILDRSIVLVSHEHHLRRSLWAYHHILDKSSKRFQIKTHRMPDKQIVRESWWLDKYSRDFISSETQKLLFYWMNYGLLNKTEKKDVLDVEFQDAFRMDETRYNSSRVDEFCKNDPY